LLNFKIVGVTMAMVHCRDCGKKISDSASSCPSCGALQSSNVGGSTKKVNWTVCMLVSLFLGVLGIDRFLMGHIGKGFLKMFTAGGFLVWAVIDFIRIVQKKKFEGVEWV
jgi:hypothetical protein